MYVILVWHSTSANYFVYSVGELFNLLHFLEPDKFKKESSLFEAVDDSDKLRRLRDTIQPYVLRRLKENVEKSIPKKEETIIDVELTSMQTKYYVAIVNKNRTILEDGT